MPESTSPVPAVASAGLAMPADRDALAGSATIVSSPLRTTIAPRRVGGLAGAGEPARVDLADSVPSSRPSSPACGVSTVGAVPPGEQLEPRRRAR